MTRNLYILAIAAALSGCAASRPERPIAVQPTYFDGPTASLAFTPPVSIDQPAAELWRDERQPAAFVGFDEVITTFYYLRTDDRSGDDGFNWLSRRAISERVGVSYR
jgi:hypothetical protein